MTNYALKPPQDPLPRLSWRETKEKRKKLLEEVRRRRRLIYELMQKMHSR